MYTGQADTGWMEYLCEIAHAWAHLKLWPHDVEGKIFIEHHFTVEVSNSSAMRFST